jgi:hypothetical protein
MLTRATRSVSGAGGDRGGGRGGDVGSKNRSVSQDYIKAVIGTSLSSALVIRPNLLSL